MNYQIYLAKDGKTQGPFTPEEFETIRVSGKITEYDAIFDSRTGTWQPLAVPNAPAPVFGDRKKAAPETAAPSHEPQTTPVAASHETQAAPARESRATPTAPPREARPAPAASASLRVRPVEAVCHNYRAVISGRLSRVTETGCDLISPSLRDAGPCFAERGQVFLNLLDPQSGQTMDVAAQLVAISRTAEGGWAYRLEWPNCPEILLAAG